MTWVLGHVILLGTIKLCKLLILPTSLFTDNYVTFGLTKGEKTDISNRIFTTSILSCRLCFKFFFALLNIRSPIV
jgi:hypothetical protein